MATKPFKVIRASAGSGKTYALVRQYLLLALQTPSSSYYRHILAITFTNAAAAEMKERVMLRLREFAAGTPSPLFSEICSALGLHENDLRNRAGAIYKDMLHHFGYISIQTIDSFTHKIIRSFARDLRLNHDFNIEVDETKFLEKLSDACLQQVGEDDQLTSFLTDFLLENIDEGKRLRLHDEIIEASKVTLKEETRAAMQELGDLTFEDFQSIRKNLATANRSFFQEAKLIAQKAIDLITSNGLQSGDFNSGNNGSISVFNQTLSGNLKIPGSNFHKWPTAKNKSSGSATSEAKQRINLIAEEMTALFIEYSEHVNENTFTLYEFRKKILSRLHSIGLLEHLTKLGNDLREEENVLLISDFHKKVNEVVRDNQAPYIYERLGVRYKHILIDEFQDTSLLQWSNVLPLIEESLSHDHTNLIVGDAKQSIYRWRGGNVEQFIELPKVPKEAGRPDAQRMFETKMDLINLDQNRRSAQNIVAFNNRFFKRLSAHLGNYQSVYADTKQQATKTNAGFVHYEINADSNKETRQTKTLDLILDKVRQCINDGFLPGDIAILIRKGNTHGSQIAEMLVKAGLNVVTKESFLIQNSPIVRIIMGYLTYKSDPSQTFYAIEMIQALSQINQKFNTEIFNRDYCTKKREFGKSKIELRFHDYFSEQHQINIEDTIGNPYQQAWGVLRAFQLEPDIATEFLLEKIRHYCIHKQWSLHEFISYWKDSREKLHTTSETDSHSVHIMTVHKSKGLQFPVVIFPRFSSRDHNDDIWVHTNKEQMGLPYAYVRYNKPNETTPPEFQTEFEKKTLDDTNITYVAMTRAEERLYIIQELSGRDDNFSKIFMETMENEFQQEKHGDIISLGDPQHYQSKPVNTSAESVRYPVFEHATTQLRVIPARNKKSKLREYGELVHECLSQINSPSEIESAVKKITEFNAVKDKSVQHQMILEIRNLFNNPLVASWFETDGRIFNEKELIIAEDEVARPDRVIVNKAEVCIVDYKTGEKNTTHSEQVLKYMQTLRSMYTQPVKGFLLYTKTAEVEEVSF
jgi:ATP-dependent exoDNAse (exonuclease V) beta subunit